MATPSNSLPDDPVLRRIAAFVIAKRRMVLTPVQTEAMTVRLIDAIAGAVLARTEKDSKQLKALFDGKGSALATVIGGGRINCDDAAFYNSWLIRKLDWNDTYIGRNGGHPSDFIGAVLAAGEAAGKSGHQIIRAIATGTHLMLDLCDAASAISRGWDPSTYVGIAATAAIADVLELDEAGIANAIAMTTVSRNMLLARTGRVSGWKALASATAVRDCMFHVRLAQGGLEGPDPAFSGEFGFERVISGPLELELDAGRDRSGDSHLKFYPAIYHAQGPIEACIALHKEIAGLPIEAIDIEIYDFAIRYTADSPAKWSPSNLETADHSLPFLAAHTLAKGEFGPGSLHATLNDPEVRALAEIVKVHSNHDYSARWPKATPSRIIVNAGGRRFEKHTEFIIGHPKRPLGMADVRTKFATCAKPLVGAASATAWFERMRNFAELASAEEISAALSGSSV
jgi:2-methylcitrate dehydratase